MLRRLHHSQLHNVLIRHKAQRFVALKTLHRSAALRRQLSQARAAASSVAVGASSTTAPSLDPSVKALIEKLTELAEVLPYGHSGEKTQLYGRGDPNTGQQSVDAAGYPPRTRMQNVAEGKLPLAATTTTERAAPRGLPSEITKNGAIHGWEAKELPGSLSATNEAEDGDDGFGGEEMDTTEGSLGPHVPSNEDFMGSTEEDDILTQQLRELDSNMNNVFQDLEKKGRKIKDSELFKKAGTLEKRSTEEDGERKREEDKRQKERAALLAQLEGLSGGGHTRRPLWRWVAEGVDDPNPDRVLKGKQLWKAAALLVIVFFVRPKRTLMQRKARCGVKVTQPISTPPFVSLHTAAVFHSRAQVYQFFSYVSNFWMVTRTWPINRYLSFVRRILFTVTRSISIGAEPIVRVTLRIAAVWTSISGVRASCSVCRAS